MRTGPVWLDLTELVVNPLQTGIQRVERELIRHWPNPGQLLPCRYDGEAGGFVALPDEVFSRLGARGSRTRSSTKEQLDQLRPLLADAAPVEFRADDILFNPEVFFDQGRSRQYRALAAAGRVEIAWIVYDFVVYLRPQDYPQGAVRGCMPYLQAMRDVGRAVFISEKTRADHSRIIRREVDGVVVPLGADGLELERQTGGPARGSYVCMGTIEPRKNIALLLEVFVEYWRRGGAATLVLAGRMDSRSTREIEMLAGLAGEPRLRVLGPVSDDTMREVLRDARATFYLSEFEGFGIPPLESLQAGVPVVVHNATPSIAALPGGGQIRLDRLDRDSVAASLARLEDDAALSVLWAEAAELCLPTWRDVVRQIAGWVTR